MPLQNNEKKKKFNIKEQLQTLNFGDGLFFFFSFSFCLLAHKQGTGLGAWNLGMNKADTALAFIKSQKASK